ncbi:MAG TPA: multicopper oxidase family protein [Hyphomicrobiaceae bacterium]|nr:multicopper oxidase family protein [Hyphomicrobiaceae bacterium]
MISRRKVLQGVAAVGGLAAVPMPTAIAQSPASIRTLTARMGEVRLLEPGEPMTPVWGYDGLVPGPEIRVKQGGAVAVDLLNKLPQPTTIHWHGIRNDNAMDGVAGLTQPAVKPGETFAYRFTPPDAGTYWYHPHNRTWEQMARGLYGALVVEEPTPPAADQDLVLVFDDWRLGRDGKIDEASFGAMHDIAHAGRLGNILTLNGQFEKDLEVQAGQRLRLRLINSANARVMGIVFDGHAPIVIALDGQPLEVPFAPDRNRVVLAPAQRADIILDCSGDPGQAGDILVETGRERLRMGKLRYHPTKRQRSKVLADIPVLPPNPMPTTLEVDSAKITKVDLVMSGGAMSGFDSAIYQGKPYGIRELVRAHNKAWAFNGIVDMTKEPLKAIEGGATVHVRMVNQTAWPHAMHFHGHHVKEIAHSRRKPQPYWRDTVLMQRGEEVTVAFKADNPGKWMLHCHMLEHQAGGMSTWYKVS